MKKLFIFICIILAGVCPLANTKPIFVNSKLTNALKNTQTTKSGGKIAIVIDDFGGWDRAGVDEILNSNVPITCAIMPFVDNTQQDYNTAIANGKEVILHMPMQAHVNLPESWYGPVYISNNEQPATAIEKLEKCLATMPEAKGFNIHIGSGASKNASLMSEMYKYADQHNMFFLDSRTVIEDKCEEACKMAGSTYLGRDIFLEPSKNRSYAGVTSRLNEAIAMVNEKGFCIVIGHVGAEGGVNTVRAITDIYPKMQELGINVVPLSEIYADIKAKSFS